MRNSIKHVNGWLNRQGKFYPCPFNKHNDSSIKIEARLKLKHSLAYLGWINVHDTGIWFFGADLYQGRMYVKVTQAQNKWLLDNGYNIKEYD